MTIKRIRFNLPTHLSRFAMKRIPNIVSSLIPVLSTTLLLFGVIGFSMLNVSAQDAGEARTEEPLKDDSAKEEKTQVTVADLGGEQAYYLDLLGIVSSESQIAVFPATGGQVSAVNVNEGDRVEKGDVLFVLGGLNDTEHPLLKQYRIAQTNYEAAKKMYNTALNSAGIAVNSAELQLESARHQTNGSYMDHQALAANIEASADGIGLIRNTIAETGLKNERDLNNMLEKISDMEDALDDFDETRSDTLREIREQIDATENEVAREALIKQYETTKDTLDAKRDELENGLEELEEAYKTMQSGAILTENQILGQLRQAQNQQHQLYMTADSMQWKLGLFDGSSDPLKLAEQGLENAKTQAGAAVTQAETALQLAGINLELAADQKQYLLVKAPAGGIVAAVNVKNGDVAAPQAPMTQIVETGDNVLEVGVDTESAQFINEETVAEILIGGRYVKVPVASVSPLADPVSKLVTVTLDLPNISLRPNQTLQARLAIKTAKNVGGAGAVMVPLDAVTIGTEDRYLFVIEDGKARKMDVMLGEIRGPMIEITEGLTGDEKIIVEGAREVRDGQEVTIK